MMQYVTLLRGINVGGNNVVKMADLKKALTKAGLQDVQTYIQTGNIICGGESPAQVNADIAQVLSDTFDISVASVTFDADTFRKFTNSCPAPTDDPKQVHYFMAGSSLEFDHRTAGDLSTTGENLWYMGRAICLHTPKGFARSKLAEKMPDLCNHPVTARNLNTMRKIADKLG